MGGGAPNKSTAAARYATLMGLDKRCAEPCGDLGVASRHRQEPGCPLPTGSAQGTPLGQVDQTLQALPERGQSPPPPQALCSVKHPLPIVTRQGNHIRAALRLSVLPTPSPGGTQCISLKRGGGHS